MGEVTSEKIIQLPGWALTINNQRNANETSSFLNLSVAAGATTLASSVFVGGYGRLAEFKGMNDHITTVRAEIAKKDGVFIVNILDNFTFDDAPDIKIAMGNNDFDKSTIIGPLKSLNGASSYEAPRSINPDD
jgi:hypothetical protein